MAFFYYFLFLYVIHLYFICLPSDSTMLEDDGIEPRIVATLALTPDALISRLDLIHYFYSFYFNHLILCMHGNFYFLLYAVHVFSIILCCCCFRGDPKIVYLDGVHPPLMTSASRPDTTQGSHVKAARYVKQSRHFTPSSVFKDDSSKLLPQGADCPSPLTGAGKDTLIKKKSNFPHI